MRMVISSSVGSGMTVLGVCSCRVPTGGQQGGQSVGRGGVLEVDVIGVEGAPLGLGGGRSAVGLGEQVAQAGGVHGVVPAGDRERGCSS